MPEPSQRQKLTKEFGRAEPLDGDGGLAGWLTDRQDYHYYYYYYYYCCYHY